MLLYITPNAVVFSFLVYSVVFGRLQLAAAAQYAI